MDESGHLFLEGGGNRSCGIAALIVLFRFAVLVASLVRGGLAKELLTNCGPFGIRLLKGGVKLEDIEGSLHVELGVHVQLHATVLATSGEQPATRKERTSISGCFDAGSSSSESTAWQPLLHNSGYQCAFYWPPFPTNGPDEQMTVAVNS
jgi:hypothetical protein